MALTPLNTTYSLSFKKKIFYLNRFISPWYQQKRRTSGLLVSTITQPHPVALYLARFAIVHECGKLTEKP